MSVDTTYIINQFARQKTLQVQMTNVPDTINVSVTNSDVYMEPLSHIDSVTAHIDSLSTQIVQAISALSAPVETIPNTTYELLTRWAIPLLIALIAMAAPLLLHNINGLDTKYHSTRIIDIFKKSITFCIFKYSIIIVALAIVIKFCSWTFKWSSIAMLCVSFAFLCVIVALCILIMIFYSYPHLILYIQWIYNCNCRMFRDQKSLYYRALTDCLHYAIRQNDKDKSKKLLAFFEKSFRNFRKKVLSKEDYPQEYYDFILETTDFICRENYTNIIYQDSENGYVLPVQFLFPTKQEDESSIITSEKSYMTIWKTLLMFCNYKHDELFLSYWDCIYTYYSTKLPYGEEEEFIEFHECVGALLMAHKQYQVLHDLILWTGRKKKERNIFDLRRIFIHPYEKLITLSTEDMMLRYVRLMYVLDSKESRYMLPNIAATSEMPNPLKMYCQKYMALLYLLSCNPKDKQTYFWYEEGQDLKLPDQITIQTIEKLTKELYVEAEILLQDSSIKNIFERLSKMDFVPDLHHFVEAVQDNFALHVRIQDIKPKVLESVHQIIDEKIDKAIQDIPYALSTNARGRMSILNKMYSISLCTKADLSGNDIAKNARDSIESNVYCSIISHSFDVLKTFNKRELIKCKRDSFIESLDNAISTLKNPSEYVLVCEDSRMEDVFTKFKDYKEGYYKGLSVIISTIYYSTSTTVKAWLIKKTDMPVYKVGLPAQEQEIHEYLFEKRNDIYHTQRIVLDLGRVTTTVIEQLKKEIPEHLIPKGSTIEELVLIVMYIPLGIYVKRAYGTIMQWDIDEVPLRSKQDWDYPDDDYYEEPEDPVIAHIMSPETYNEKLGLKRSKKRKQNKNKSK